MLIVLYIASIAIYLIARPRWKFIGPSLFDSYLIGVALFVVGTMLLGFGADIRVESVRTIGLVAGIFSLLGGALWGVLLRRPIHNLKFWSWIREIEMAATERSIVTAGLLVSAAVCVAYVGAILASPGLRALIVDGLQHRMSTPWRLGITDGHYGYFGVGYVKQFRDIAIPVLCGAIILIGEPRARWPFWIGILAGLAAILITQERLIVIEFALCLFGSYVVGAALGRRPWRVVPLPQAVGVLIVLVGLTGLMTVWLGRLPANPPQQHAAVAVAPVGVSRSPVPAAAANSPASAPQQEGAIVVAAAPAVVPTQQETAAPADAPVGVPPQQKALVAGADVGGEGDSKLLNLASEIVIGLASRSVTIVPQENVETYHYWADQSPVYGRGWLSLVVGLLPGRQTDISNQLSTRLYGGGSNSPLALATDLYYNWGVTGVALFSALFGLGFLALDIALTRRRSATLATAKIYLFCSIPTMYNFSVSCCTAAPSPSCC